MLPFLIKFVVCTLILIIAIAIIFQFFFTSLSSFVANNFPISILRDEDGNVTILTKSSLENLEGYASNLEIFSNENGN